jgi:hypothetical protein
MNENDITREVVDSAIEAHRTLGGPGLLESVYEEALDPSRCKRPVISRHGLRARLPR